MIIHFSSASTDWHTPPEYAEAVRHVLGGTIELDPASNGIANGVIGAERIITEEGETADWGDARTLYINPPGGWRPGKPRVTYAAAFWDRLMTHRKRDDFVGAIWCCFNSGHLQVLQRPSGSVTDYAICIPRKRVHYVSATQDAKAPPHASAFVCVNHPAHAHVRRRFRRTFKDFGGILLPDC